MKVCLTPLDVLDGEGVKLCEKEVEVCVREAPEGAHGLYFH